MSLTHYLLLTDLLTTYSGWMGVLCVVRLGTDSSYQDLMMILCSRLLISEK